jgi:hypothetical protein
LLAQDMIANCVELTALGGCGGRMRLIRSFYMSVDAKYML